MIEVKFNFHQGEMIVLPNGDEGWVEMLGYSDGSAQYRVAFGGEALMWVPGTLLKRKVPLVEDSD